MEIISFRHLETLLWIARLGTFTAAAERLNTTQPSISGRVRELERRLGVKLFHKSGRNMVLTVKGRDVVRRCEALWKSFEDLAPDPSGLGGTVRIGAGEIAAATLLPNYFAELQSDMPLLTMEVRIELTATMLQDLMKSTLDIIFLPGPSGGPDLRVEELGSIKLIWVASPQQAADIGPDFRNSDVPIWSLPSHSPIYAMMMREFSGSRYRDRNIHSCNNVQTLVDTVASGRGATLVPECFAAAAITQGRLTQLHVSSYSPKLPVSVAIRASEKDPAVLHIFEKARQLRF